MLLATGGRNAAVDAIAALANGGTLQIRTGAQPATPQTAASGTLLGTLNMSATAFGNAVAGVATANAITSDSSADATGTAGWFRILQSNGTTAVIDGTVGTSGADLNLDSVSIVAGGTISVTSQTITMPQ